MVSSHVFQQNLYILQASWTLAHFAETKFQTEPILVEAVRLIVNSLLSDKELRVKVQAALSLQMLLIHQNKVQDYLRPHVNSLDPFLFQVQDERLLILYFLL